MDSAPDKFVSQEISVVRDQQSGQPESFVWNDKVYRVQEIIAVWPDYGFSAGAPKKKNWRMRRHRNWFRLETTQNEIFEIYHDRGIKPGEGKWILAARLR